MKKLVTGILSLAVVAGLGLGAAVAEEAAGGAEHGGGTPHYPIHKPEQQDWSFAGPFGNYDKGQLQRGLKIYTEVCSACHSMNLVAFRTLEGLGYSDAQVKAFAANYEVQDGPNADGEMYTRKAVPADHFPSPYPNKEAAAASNNGAAPPDFSLIAKARGIERGFPQFVFDMFWPYQEGGPDYIHALLTGYHEPPEGVQVAEGTHYNPYFANASALAMAQPISNDQVTYEDGTPQTVDQYAKDVSAFLMWAAEPHLEDRKRTGFMVMVFLLIFTGLVYLTKKSVYANKEH
ncbi:MULTISPECIES: cytochrome c1 [Ensifer]|jgi:ubiquinol-cytochrome c reductase cytochrome c1 subunit|uniref:Cytochrome c1 n=1 Tax=Ensifer canadensis TaxID=555315 RepID=A0AAW4FYZ6_9HYPH|nr:MULTISPECIES: cytochrome c1 [Ensifer]AHK44504.1 cytochrome c1 [Ensifer adhaerens OV14]MDP9630632.1 ubiquinol-cytochrome c reductase cytochrome c1 subunit [Ensifer adhaerens]KQU86022.1 ribosomal protein P2 [Ensifer sp. Root31]KQW58897.1 ribosomal protein P2 [Ensifer sp. Root1252]KQW74602.1 ribosomal protein P2 [Ensifer sp. Root127]